MSAYVIVEFTVKDPDVYREKYAPIAGQTAKEHGGEVLAAGNWDVLHGDGSLTSGALVRFPDRETALGWYHSPEYQQLIDVRSVAMDARFSLLDGLPRPTEDERASPMSALPGKAVLITGANVGIGKEVARQLASRPEMARIYLACRNRDRARTAKAELESETGRRIFDIVVIDVADLGSVRAGLAAIDGSIDALVMNAGIIGPKTMDLTADGVTTVFATNVLGHVVLLEGLLADDRLGEVAVFAGSEAVRGVPKLRMKGPSFVSTSADELATVIDGSYFASRKADFNLAFGQAKYIGALWMAYLARRHPDRRFITVSPGNTTGTQAPSDLPLPMRVAAKYVMPALGLAHKLDVGAKRLVDGVTDPTLSSGTFYASAANTLTGPLVNQADFLPDLANPSFQDNAGEAIHRFIS